MLTSDADDTFVVLIWYVEGDRSWHLLLNQVETILGSVILAANNVNVEVVLIEAVEDDLNVACTRVSITFSYWRSGILWPIILLILPFFLPLTNSLCSLASSILTRI